MTMYKTRGRFLRLVRHNTTQSRDAGTVPLSLYAYLNDGSVRLFDATSLIAKGGVFAPLADMQVFRSAATVMNDTIV
jgi:hypothetical protein